jgi:uncharacterized protein (TIGR02145 family)
MIMKKKICTLLIFLFFSIDYIQAQDYLISFNGSGASTTVDSVRVENITQRTEVKLSGNDVLHLKSVVTGIEQTADYNRNRILFSPNPVSSYSRMRFILPEPGATTITMFDISGREIFQKQENLSQGEHIYRLEGVNRGIYLVTISTGRYSVTGRLISNGPQEGAIKLTYENTISTEKKLIGSKGSKGEIEMQYNPDDRLIFTASGGECISLVSDVASSSKTITFNFQPCKDGDNNKYPTVKIGTQIWMAANLKTTKYNNGDPIPLVTDDAAWLALRYEAAYCWYDNDGSTYKNIFGALYNFWAVSPGNLCPAGWHVPAYDEFALLENYLIQNGYNYDNLTYGNNIGKSLASTAMISLTTLPSVPSIMWEYSSDDGTVGNTDFPIKRNATGFSALPSGFRGNGFSVINTFAFWWSSTSVDMGFARYRDLQSNWESLLGGSTSKWVGYSVRCLKDQ